MLIVFSDNKYPSSWTSSAVQKLFQESPDQTIVNTTNTTNSTNPSTAFVTLTEVSQRSNSNSSLGHGALAGVIVGCITASILCVAIIIYTIKKRRRRRNIKKSMTIGAVPTDLSSVTTNGQGLGELSTERAPQEIMCERNDRTELFVSRREIPAELGPA